MRLYLEITVIEYDVYLRLISELNLLRYTFYNEIRYVIHVTNFIVKSALYSFRNQIKYKVQLYNKQWESIRKAARQIYLSI